MVAENKPKGQLLASDYRNVFDTAAGRRVLAHLMSECNFFAPWPTPDGKNADVVHGERNVITLILKQCGLADMTVAEYLRLAGDARHLNQPDDILDYLNKD